uniref:RING-type domain-containing protein n=1 Tax=Plectus sambesii TaxID=2011161 RepID=A0A914UME8_9BILA
MDVLPSPGEQWNLTIFGTVCDGCYAPLQRGQGLHCAVCPNYDLCNDCVAVKKHFQHRGGFVKRPQRAEAGLHRSIGCDSCDEQIYGCRFKCKLCPDYDLCWKCFNRDAHKDFHVPKASSPASSQSVKLSGGANVVIECTICWGPYNSDSKCPRSIQCGHTFCTECIDQLIESQRNKFSCPKCRKEFNISSSNDLAKNFGLLEALTQITSATENAMEASTCEGCDSVVACEKLRYCQTCSSGKDTLKKYLCAECCLTNHAGHQIQSDFEIRKHMRQVIDSDWAALKKRITDLQGAEQAIASKLRSAQQLSNNFLKIQLENMELKTQNATGKLSTPAELTAEMAAFDRAEQFISAASSASDELLSAVMAYREKLIDQGLNNPVFQECATLACQRASTASDTE